MTQLLEIHPTHPQARLLERAANVLRDGGVIAYPTDSCYALGCGLDSKDGPDRIRKLRTLGKAHHFSIMCADLAEVARYARLDNDAFRWLKLSIPGPYTFILRATGDVPKRVQHARRRTTGVRVPDNPVTRGLLEQLGAAMVSSTLQLPGSDQPEADARDIFDAIGKQVDLVIDGGPGSVEPSTLVDLSGGGLEVLREGCGDPSIFA